MDKLLRFGALFCCICLSQTLSADNYVQEDAGVEYSGVPVHYDDHCCEEVVECAKPQMSKKRIPKVLRHDRVERWRLVPQKYCATICRYETVCEEVEDCNGWKKKCYHEVPRYYTEERCRLVPERYPDTVCRYETKCCEVNECSKWTCLERSFDADFGYRRDELTCLINHYSPPGTFVVSDDLKIKNIPVWEGGIKGKCIGWNSWLVKGSAYFGVVTGGDYTETIKPVVGNTTTLKLDVRHGRTVDFSVGGGYLFPICTGIRIGPTGGWSYNAQKLKMKSDIKVLDGLEYKNRWQGGWVGADALISFCGFGLHAGYEYHIPKWNGDWLLKGPDVFGGAFSDVRHSTNGYGNVAFIEASTVRFGSIRFNCQLKYQYWKMKDGREHPKNGSFASVGGTADEVDKIPRATWQSFEAIVGLGLDF